MSTTIICNAIDPHTNRPCGFRSPDGFCEATAITIEAQTGMCRYINHPYMTEGVGRLFSFPVPDDQKQKINILNIVKKEENPEQTELKSSEQATELHKSSEQATELHKSSEFKQEKNFNKKKNKNRKNRKR